MNIFSLRNGLSRTNWYDERVSQKKNIQKAKSQAGFLALQESRLGGE